MKSNEMIDIYRRCSNQNRKLELNLLEILYGKTAHSQSVISRYQSVREINFAIQNQTRKQYAAKENYQHIKDQLYQELFHMWKEKVLGVTPNTAQLAGIEIQDLERLKMFLNETQESITYQDLLGLFQYPLMEKYCPFIQKSALQKIVSSDYVWESKQNEKNHVLYLNMENMDAEIVVLKLVQKCHAINFPYDITYCVSQNRDASITIEASDDTVFMYLDLLEQVLKEQPTLKKRIYEPPYFTGHYDGWIGYASKKEQNYFQNVSENIETFYQNLTEELLMWIVENKDIKLTTSSGRIVNIKEYLKGKETIYTKDDMNYVVRKFYPEMALQIPELKSFVREKIRIFLSRPMYFTKQMKEQIQAELRDVQWREDFIVRNEHRPWNRYKLCQVLPKKVLNRTVYMASQDKMTLQDVIYDQMEGLIPENGMYQLKNGKMMRVDDFIKDIYLYQGRYQYGGDIKKTLQALVVVPEKEVVEKTVVHEKKEREDSSNRVRKIEGVYQLLQLMSPSQRQTYFTSPSGLQTIQDLENETGLDEVHEAMRKEMLEQINQSRSEKLR